MMKNKVNKHKQPPSIADVVQNFNSVPGIDTIAFANVGQLFFITDKQMVADHLKMMHSGVAFQEEEADDGSHWLDDEPEDEVDDASALADAVADVDINLEKEYLSEEEPDTEEY